MNTRNITSGLLASLNDVFGQSIEIVGSFHIKPCNRPRHKNWETAKK